ncbi:MAG: hypothetical protein R3200_06540 [Xanthomonadales bacterium]|nr:hypothetical protein [Xanthomonadales bacterium]
MGAMADTAQKRQDRAARRCNWPVRGFELGEDPNENLSDLTTPAERLSMMWELALQAWQLAGHSLPEYDRSSMPGRVFRSGQ